MKRVKLALAVGLLIGGVTVFALIVLHGANLAGARSGHTQTFLGVEIMSSEKHGLPDGGSTVSLSYRWGMLVPLLLPTTALLLLHGALVAVRTRSQSRLPADR